MKLEILNTLYNLYEDLWKDLEIGYQMDSKKLNRIWEYIQLYELLNSNLTKTERLKIEKNYGMWM